MIEKKLRNSNFQPKATMHKFETYKKRAVQFLEQYENEGWRIKVYGITANSEALPPALVKNAKHFVLPHLPQPGVSEQRYGVGFLIIHQGLVANWFLLNWWADEDILHQLLYSSPVDAPNSIAPVADPSIMACVFELDVYNFEKVAWIDSVLANADGPDFEQYLQKKMDTT